MKTLIISLLLFFTVNAQSIWYVNRDADGTDDGESWANACTTVTQVFTKAITGGDSVYVSGGTDSTVYGGGGIYGGIFLNDERFDSYVIVTPAWESGHDGDVYFTTTGMSGDARALIETDNCKNIKFTGFYLRNLFTDGGEDTLTYFCLDQNSRNLVYDNFNIYSWGQGFVFNILSDTSITISNNYYITAATDYNQPTDPVYMSGGYGDHTITGNTFIIKVAAEPGGEHADFIQIGGGYEGGTGSDMPTMTIANNFFMFDPPTSTSTSGGIYLAWPRNINFLIYNNVFNVTQGSVQLLTMAQCGACDYTTLDATYNTNARVLNNTFITQDVADTVYGMTWRYLDTLIIKNNIQYRAANGLHALLNYKGEANMDSVDIDYNTYYQIGNTPVMFDPDGTLDVYSWSEWQALGYDANSSYGIPTFTDWSSTTISDYSVTSGDARDGGIDISAEYPFLATDILGNARSGSWDMGALQFNGDSWLRSSNGRRIFSSDGKAIIMADE